MDKRVQKTTKERKREKSAKRFTNIKKNPQYLLQKDVIYCQNTIQNNNPNINININIKNPKNKSSNRIRSAHYTINSHHFNKMNKSLDKNKPHELKKLYLKTNINNNNPIYNNTATSNTKFKSLRTYLTNPNRNSNSNPKLKNSKNKIKLNKINTNISNKKIGNNKYIEKIFVPRNSLFENDL